MNGEAVGNKLVRVRAGHGVGNVIESESDVCLGEMSNT